MWDVLTWCDNLPHWQLFNFSLIFFLISTGKTSFFWFKLEFRKLNSKNRNDVTYFLKIETYVILIGLIFFLFISLYYCYTFSNNWFSRKIKRNKLEVYFWWNKKQNSHVQVVSLRLSLTNPPPQKIYIYLLRTMTKYSLVLNIKL